MKKPSSFFLPASVLSLSLSFLVSSCGEKETSDSGSRESGPPSEEVSPKDLSRGLGSADEKVVRSAIIALEEAEAPAKGDLKVASALQRYLRDSYEKRPREIEIKNGRVADSKTDSLRFKARTAFHKWATSADLGFLGYLDQLNTERREESLILIAGADRKLGQLIASDRSIDVNARKRFVSLLSEEPTLKELAAVLKQDRFESPQPLVNAADVAESIEELTPSLSHSDPLSRLAAVKKFCAIAGSTDLPQLREVLRSADEFSACWPEAMRAIARVAPDEFEKSYMQHATNMAFRASVCGDWTIPGRAPEDLLLKLLKNSNVIPAGDAAYALSQFSTKKEVLSAIKGAARKHPKSLALSYAVNALEPRVNGSAWELRLSKALSEDAEKAVAPFLLVLKDDEKSANDHKDALSGLLKFQNRLTAKTVSPELLVRRFQALKDSGTRFRDRDVANVLMRITPQKDVNMLAPLVFKSRQLLEHVAKNAPDALIAQIQASPKQKLIDQHISKLFKQGAVDQSFLSKLLRDDSVDVAMTAVKALTDAAPDNTYVDDLQALADRLPVNSDDSESKKKRNSVLRALHRSMHQRLTEYAGNDSEAYVKAWESVFKSPSLDLRRLASYLEDHNSRPEGASEPVAELDYIRDFFTHKNPKDELAACYFALCPEVAEAKVKELLFQEALPAKARGMALFALLKQQPESGVTLLPEILEKDSAFFESASSPRVTFLRQLEKEPLPLPEKSLFPLFKTKDQNFLETLILTLGYSGTELSLPVLPKVVSVHSDLDTGSLEQAVKRASRAIKKRSE